MVQNHDSSLVLIIDDDELTRLVLDNLLKKEHFRVLQAEDGEQGVALAQEAKPDIILLDVFMPNMDGFEVLAMLKKNPDLRDVPVCIFSILNQEDRKDKALAMGAAAFISKPFNIKEVVTLVKEWLPKR